MCVCACTLPIHKYCLTLLLSCNKHKYRAAIIGSRSASLYIRVIGLYTSFRAKKLINGVYCEIIALCVKENEV